jgi:hypothetical protein
MGNLFVRAIVVCAAVASFTAGAYLFGRNVEAYVASVVEKFTANMERSTTTPQTADGN